MFNSHTEKDAYGFPIDQPKLSQALEEASNNPYENIHKLINHLVKDGGHKEEDSKILVGPDLLLQE